MPALNFKQEFADLVESGKKRQTIRAYRKDGRDPKPGDTLYLYTGMRTKQCRKLGEAVCGGVYTFGLSWSWQERGIVAVRTGRGCPVHGGEEVATQDGFESLADMVDWFEKVHGLPFEGVLIRWGKLREAPTK